MPLFYFRIHDGLELPDDDGIELPNIRIARRTAVRVAADCLRDHFDGFRRGGEWAMDVADESGKLICALRFTASDAPVASTG